MSNFSVSPNMNLNIPNVGVDPGPDWANNLNASLVVIDQHNHAPGSGVQINPAGILINSDLPFGTNNATLLRSVRFNPNGSSPLSGANDIGCIYEAGSGGDLYYNDASGNQIQITKNGLINATSSGISSGTASASFVAGVLVVDAAALTPANIQGASLLMGNNVASTNYLTLSPPNAMASSFTITLPSVPSVLSSMTLDSSGNMGTITFDQVGVNMTSVGANAIAASRTRSISNPTAAVGGIAYSSSCGTFSTNNNFNTPITNLNVTLSTSGRPVIVMLAPSPSPSLLAQIFISGGGGGTILITNTTTGVNIAPFTFGPAGNLYMPSLQALDISVSGSPGSYNYIIYASSPGGGSDVVFVENCIMMAYEI